MSANDSTKKTLLVALLLCVVCSVMVSSAAVLLKEPQEINKSLDKKKNILKAAGLYSENINIEQVFKTIEAKVVNVKTGEYVDSVEPQGLDEKKAAKDPSRNITLKSKNDLANIKRISQYYVVYLVKDEGKISKIILPVNGKGLWSTLYGFVAIDRDMNTIKGLTFYEHAETPGLGGEVDNPSWKAQWPGKKVYSEDNNVQIQLIKGKVDKASTPDAEHKVDGLAGATLTSNGVTNLMKFWMGENGFGKYINRMRKELNSNQPIDEGKEG